MKDKEDWERSSFILDSADLFKAVSWWKKKALSSQFSLILSQRIQMLLEDLSGDSDLRENEISPRKCEKKRKKNTKTIVQAVIPNKGNGTEQRS